MNPKPNAEATGPAQARNAWLSVKDAAAALGVSARTVRRRIERGELAGAMSPLDGGGRAWLVSLEIGDDPKKDDRAAKRTDSVRTANGQRAAKRTDSVRTANGQRAAKRTDSAVNRSNKRESERTDSERTACGQASGQRADSERTGRTDSVRTGAAMPTDREPTRREIEQQEEIRFLRGTIEQLQRDGAEVRAALRAALKLAAPQSAPQLTAGDSSGVAGVVVAAAPLDATRAIPATRAASGDAPASSGAQVSPDRAQFELPDPTTGAKSSAAPLTIGDIADRLERDLKERNFNLG